MTHTLASYGADQHGLVCGYRFTAGASSPVDSEAAAALLADPAAPGFLWLHFNLTHSGALPWLQRHGGRGDDRRDRRRSGSCGSMAWEIFLPQCCGASV
jgi:zinc transporter